MTLKEVKAEMKRLNHVVFMNDSRPYNLNIIGVRSRNRKAGNFDDELHVFWKYAGEWNNIIFNKFTTDPGRQPLFQMRNPDGVAILKEGQYRSAYRLDLHKGSYLALCQRLRPVTVYRDNNKDGILNTDFKTQTGYFGINIHRAGQNFSASEVGLWSEGCQVFADPEEFQIFISLIKKAVQHWGNKFTYTLINEV